METTTEALDAITLDTWNNVDPTRKINSFMARHAFALVEADDYASDEELFEDAA